MKILRIVLSLFLGLLLIIFAAKPALAFCGFYVAKADSSLYNQASQVIIARNGRRTVLTMSNDYQGDVKDFAMVVPVPVVLTKEQVHIADPKIIERLDAFSAPRLVEYFAPDPVCPISMPASVFGGSKSKDKSENVLGVDIEKQFTVGEYDIVILSANESDGLETWLRENGYNLTAGTKELLQSYIRQQMKFFVAKVNLEKFDSNGFRNLRPISIAYESPKFTLPIRLGMVNAKGEQDLLVYLLSPQGQTELTNYRTVKVSSNLEIPEFIKDDFGNFYEATFYNTYQKENKKVAVLEYAWDMNWCDPCSADPLNKDELKQAGVFWLNDSSQNNVFITRLHVRDNRDRFPEDLVFQSTSNKQSFQGRYIINHPYTNKIGQTCPEELQEIEKELQQTESEELQGIKTKKQLLRLVNKKYSELAVKRQEKQVQNIARLTGWDIKDIRNRVDSNKPKIHSWWQKLGNW